MSKPKPQLSADLSSRVLAKLTEFQRLLRDLLLQHRHPGNSTSAMHHVSRSSSADTIYAIDDVVEACMVDFFEEWSKELPLVLIAEGLRDEHGNEGRRVFPAGCPESAASIRILVDPIDGTRELMYDKRSAWTLAGVAANRGEQTRISDIEIAVMTELPTSKQGLADVLWAIRGTGAQARRVDLSTGKSQPLALHPSTAQNIDHGFAMISSFFPGTKVSAGELMEQIVQMALGPLDVHSDTVFEDQYISTAGQFYELIVGHDRFNADVRPLFYKMENKPEGLCCHPYDCATLLIAQEAGVVITDALGKVLDGPMDTTTGLNWAGFANVHLRALIEPLIISYFRNHGVSAL